MRIKRRTQFQHILFSLHIWNVNDVTQYYCLELRLGIFSLQLHCLQLIFTKNSYIKQFTHFHIQVNICWVKVNSWLFYLTVCLNSVVVYSWMSVCQYNSCWKNKNRLSNHSYIRKLKYMGKGANTIQFWQFLYRILLDSVLNWNSDNFW